MTMNKDLESLSEIERLLEDLTEKERERIIDWLIDKYLPSDDEEEQQAQDNWSITYWPNCFNCPNNQWNSGTIRINPDDLYYKQPQTLEGLTYT